MHNDDDALIGACQSGDIEAFEVLVRKYQDRLLRVLYLLLGNADDAQDVGQETFIRAFKYIRSFRGGSSFATWLHRIGVNTSRNWVRDNRRNTEQPTAPEVLRTLGGDNPEDMLIAKERQIALQSTLLQMPVHYREAIVLRYYDDLSYEEIAEVQQVPVGTVRSRLAKAKVLLHALLSNVEGASGDGKVLQDELQRGTKTHIAGGR